MKKLGPEVDEGEEAGELARETANVEPKHKVNLKKTKAAERARKTQEATEEKKRREEARIVEDKRRMSVAAAEFSSWRNKSPEQKQMEANEKSASMQADQPTQPGASPSLKRKKEEEQAARDVKAKKEQVGKNLDEGDAEVEVIGDSLEDVVHSATDDEEGEASNQNQREGMTEKIEKTKKKMENGKKVKAVAKNPKKKVVKKGDYTCELCGQFYSDSNNRSTHVNRVHKIPMHQYTTNVEAAKAKNSQAEKDAKAAADKDEQDSKNKDLEADHAREEQEIRQLEEEIGGGSAEVDKGSMVDTNLGVLLSAKALAAQVPVKRPGKKAGGRRGGAIDFMKLKDSKEQGSKEKVIPCELCGEVVKSLHALKMHVKRDHVPIQLEEDGKKKHQSAKRKADSTKISAKRLRECKSMIRSVERKLMQTDEVEGERNSEGERYRTRVCGNLG